MRYYKQSEPQRVYRTMSHGPLLDLFVVDMRSCRGPNSANLQIGKDASSAFMGREQIEWLIAGLKASTSIWKVISADMPIGLNVGDGENAQGADVWEALANGNNGAPLGREIEIARLLGSIKAVPNVVWITTDVHYCAAHYYDPAQARFTNFSPFWEFVAGPMNAGAFGPGVLDKTFGLTAVFSTSPSIQNFSPFAGYQFFGEVNIDPRTEAMKVELFNLDGDSQFAQVLPAVGG